ncbi:MAG: hypothetical protein ACE5FY_00910 [Nitrospiria bacterium]
MRFEEVYKKLEKEAIDPRRSDGRYARKRRIVYNFQSIEILKELFVWSHAVNSYKF